MHPTYLSGIERGIRNPTWSKVNDLTRALGVTVTAVVRAAEDEAEVARVMREARAHLDLARRYDG